MATEQIGLNGQSLFDRAVAAGVPSEIAADLRLVAAELATNAFEHGETSEVTISLEPDAESVSLRLRYRDAGIAPDPNHAVMPPPTSERGRGLALVAAVASTVTRRLVDGVTSTVVTFDLPAIASH